MWSGTAAPAALATPPVLRIRLPPAWTPEEDARLERLAREHGFRHWRRVAARMGSGRSSRECRGRWRHHLARHVYHRPFTARDDDDLARLYVRHGGRWRDMSRAVGGRISRVMRRRRRELREATRSSASSGSLSLSARSRRRSSSSSTCAWGNAVYCSTPTHS